MDYCSGLEVRRRQEIPVIMDKPESSVSERRQTNVIGMMAGSCVPANANLTSVQKQAEFIRNSLHWEEFFGNLEFFVLFYFGNSCLNIMLLIS